jgi:UDP-GlcNAc:undecaprenyl-phosphate/decaprenyl-phosphate GlcNAc-1-phosphate transferase
VVGYGIVFVVAALATYLLAFPVSKYAPRLGAVVVPGERRIHAEPTPTLGGVAMFGAFILAMIVASVIPQFRGVFHGSSEPEGVLLAAMIIFLVHVIDDLREISAPAKIAGMVLAGTALYHLGVTMFFFKVPFAGTVSISPDLAPLATVLWVIIICNAVNLIDGLDGLAAGVVGIGAFSFFLYGDRLFKAGVLGSDNVGPLIAIIACGICVGFLPHNYHPAKIFMGDSGAMLLGLLLAASTLVVSGRTDDPFSGQTYFFFAPVLIPFVILGVPILDTVWAVLRRARSRSGIATPDKMHLHHRLMRLGHGQRRAVAILWTWTALLSGVVLLPTYTHKGNAFIPFVVIGLAVALYTLFHPEVRRKAHDHAVAHSLLDIEDAAADETAAQEAKAESAETNGNGASTKPAEVVGQ